MPAEEITSEMAKALQVSEGAKTASTTATPPTPATAATFTPPLPPHMAVASSKSTDEIISDLKAMPLFMTELPEEETIEMAALQALADEGTPLESALDFKEQGNEHFQAKVWMNAKELYAQGIEVLVLRERMRAKAANEAAGVVPSMRESVERPSDKEEDVVPLEGTLGLKNKNPKMMVDEDGGGDEDGEEGQEKEKPETEEEIRDQRKCLETLYVNRAAAHLELGNFRSAALDCAAALRLNPKNVKAYYRSGRALLSVSRIEEADDACARGLDLDPKNKALLGLATQIIAKANAVAAKKKAQEVRETRDKYKGTLLKAALQARGIKTRKTNKPPEMEDGRVKMVPDEYDPRSELCFPAILLYPTELQSDFVREFQETHSVGQHLEYVFPTPWDKKGEFTPEGVECYMDTLSGGLIKVGKNVSLLKVLGSGKVEVVDELVRIYVVPRGKAEGWVKEHKATKAAKAGKT